MLLYTAQFAYPGKDRLDITMNTIDPLGMVFAPPKRIVNGFKYDNMTEDEYESLYYNYMVQSFYNNQHQWNDVLSQKEITLVCYCSANTFCHRYLLAHYLVKLGAQYCGEKLYIKKNTWEVVINDVTYQKING